MAIPTIVLSGSSFPPGIKLEVNALYNDSLVRLYGFLDAVMSASLGSYTTGAYEFYLIEAPAYEFVLAQYPHTESVWQSYTASFSESFLVEQPISGPISGP